MKVIDSLRCYLFSRCSSSANNTINNPKKRDTSSKRDHHPPLNQDQAYPSSPSNLTIAENPPQRPRKSNVTGTIFGQRHARARFCIQEDSHGSKPPLLLELSVPMHVLAKEMQSGLLRISLECDRSELSSCSLHSVPLWSMYCNGRKVGFAARRRATDKDHKVLTTVQATSAGAGAIPPPSAGEEEVVYMRASYERVVGSCDSESFHLINPTGSPGQELSVFLLRAG